MENQKPGSPDNDRPLASEEQARLLREAGVRGGGEPSIEEYDAIQRGGLTEEELEGRATGHPTEPVEGEPAEEAFDPTMLGLPKETTTEEAEAYVAGRITKAELQAKYRKP